jgi:hypothetical protein
MRNKEKEEEKIKTYGSKGRTHGRCTPARGSLASSSSAGWATLQEKIKQMEHLRKLRTYAEREVVQSSRNC